MSDDLLTTGQAAELLKVSRVTIWRWATDGALPVALFVHGQRRFRRADVLALVTIPPEVAS